MTNWGICDMGIWPIWGYLDMGFGDLDMPIWMFGSYAGRGQIGARRGQGGDLSITMGPYIPILLPKSIFLKSKLLITIIISNIYLWKTMWKTI